MTSRGTTPTYILTFPDTIDLTTMDDIKVTIADSSYNNLLTFEKADLTIDTTSISVFLTQEQTLALPLGTLLIQVNMTFTEGGLVKRIASEIVRVQSAKRQMFSSMKEMSSTSERERDPQAIICMSAT